MYAGAVDVVIACRCCDLYLSSGILVIHLRSRSDFDTLLHRTFTMPHCF